MEREEKILSDYHGALYHIKGNKNKDLTIFLVDDDLFYLNLLEKQLSKNPKFEIFTFSTGEKCLNSLELKPDLVILDYHLDGKYSYAKKGNIIAKEIKKSLPQTETIIISSDHKLPFIEQLKDITQRSIFFKDSFVIEKIQSKFLNILKKRKEKWLQQAIFPSLLITIILISIIIYIKL